MKGYIQWYLDDAEMAEATQPFLRYKNARAEAINRASFNMYGKIISERFENNQQTAEYLRLVRKLINNEHFVSAFDEVVNNLSFPEWTNRHMFIKGIQEQLIQNSTQYTQFTSEIKQSLQSIINTLGVADLNGIVPDSDAYKELVKLYDGDVAQVNTIISLDRHKTLENTFRGQYAAMISKLPDFINILMTPGSDRDAAFQTLARMLMPIQTLIGICSEYQAEHELNKLLQDLEKSSNLSGMTITRVGDEKDSGFRIGTADLSIVLGDNANMSFQVPNLGMSLKRTHKNVHASKDITVKLKGSTYGGLMQAIDPQLVTAFYTIYANTRPIINGKRQSDIPAGALTSAYAQMKARMLVTALIGGANSDNLVFVMVINNKAFTIFDLLAKLKEETYANESTILLKPSFRTMRGGIKLKDSDKASNKQLDLASGVLGMHQKYYIEAGANKELRSNNIRKFIDNISASMEMKITQKLLSSI